MGDSVSAQLMQSPEFAPQVQGLDRQRKIAEMLMTQGFQPQQGQMVSGRYVAPSWTQQLAGLANIWAGKGIMEEAEQKQIDLAKALRGKQQEAVEEYFKAIQPTAAIEGQAPVIPKGQTLYDNDGTLTYGAKEGTPGTPAKGPDYARALKIATGEYAPNWLSTQAISNLKPFDLEEGKIRYQINPLTGEKEIIAQGGEKKSNEMRNYETAVKQGFQGTFPQYEIMLKKAGASNVSVALPPAESEYVKTFGAGLAKQDLALRDIASNAPQAITSIQNQRKLLDSGKVITGIGANQRLDLARLGSEIGVGGRDVKELTSNTQQLMAGRAGATLDAIKASGLGSGTGFSNADRDFLEKAKMGGITYDKAALQKQLALEEKVARIGANQWNERLKTMPKSAGVVNPQTIQLPPEIGTTDVRSKADAIINQGQ